MFGVAVTKTSVATVPWYAVHIMGTVLKTNNLMQIGRGTHRSIDT